jgi:hypothetical protein
LLPEETVCNKCSNNSKLPPRRDCPWCAEPLPRGMVICRHCHADLAVPEAEPIHCGTCGAAVSAQALACIRCGTPVAATLSTSVDPERTQPMDLLPPGFEQASSAGRAAHVEMAFTPPPAQRGTANPSPASAAATSGGQLSTSLLVGMGVGLAFEFGLFAWLIGRGTVPLPRDWLDIRVTAWIVAHAVAFLATMILAVAAAGVWKGIERQRVWSPGAVAFGIAAPSLAFPWMAGRLWQGLADTLSRLFRGERSTYSPAEPPRDPLLSAPQVRSGAWTVAALIEAVVALAVCAALVWPESWRSDLPAAVLGVVDWVQQSGLWLRWLLAVLGVGHIFAAAFGWYWETYDEGGIVTWLSPVVLLAPGLVFLSTALLTGLGTDIAGPGGFRLSAALRDSALLWGLLSLYGLYYLITSWAAMRGLVTVAVLGYALCGPLMLSGWVAGRKAEHGLECARRLNLLAAGLRRYAETYQQLPPSVVTDAAGRPLHSWRVLLLPFVGEEPLYAEFGLDEPWNAPANRRLREQRPDVFACDELAWDDAASTQFVAVVDERSYFPPGKSVLPGEMHGVGAQGLVLLEVGPDRRIPWTSPQDVSVEELASLVDGASSHGERLQAVAADGTVVEVRPEIGPDGQPLPLALRFWRPAGLLP